MHLNMLVVALAALIPLIIGFIWYNNFAFGNVWMREAGLTAEQLKTGSMAKVFILTYIFSFMIAFFLGPVVIHQAGLYSMLMGNPDMANPSSELSMTISSLMEKYGHNYRTFKHGALHGTISAIFFVMPVIGINALFEKKSGKYIFIHAGFWIVCLAIMGGIICQFA